MVTEISYKTGSSIEADVEFLTIEEWKADLEPSMKDLRDSSTDGQGVVKPGKVESEAGIAWQKVNAIHLPFPYIPY